MAGYDPSTPASITAHSKSQVCCGQGGPPPNFSVTSGGGAGSPLILQIPREARPPDQKDAGCRTT